MAPPPRKVSRPAFPSQISGRSHAYSALAATRGQARFRAGRQAARLPAGARAAAARSGCGAHVPRPRLGSALRRRAVTALPAAARWPGSRPGRQPPAQPGDRNQPGNQDQPGDQAPGTSPAARQRPADGAWPGPVRAGAGGNAGRVPAATADIDLGHRPRPGQDPAAGPDARGRPAAPAAPGGGVPARVRRDRDDCGGELRAPGPRPGRPPGAQPATPGPARPSAPESPVAVHGSRGRLTGPPTRQPGPDSLAGGHRVAGSRRRSATRLRGCGGRRGSACTCGPTRRGTGRYGRPG